MKQNKIFFDVYKNLSTRRFIIIGVLLFFVLGVLYYFNQISRELAEREKVYVDLYIKSLEFLHRPDAFECDMTLASEVIRANTTIPVIYVADGSPNSHKNIPELNDTLRFPINSKKAASILKKAEEMAKEHAPVPISNGATEGFLYYSDSNTLKTLKYFPYVIISTLLLFGGLAYISYSSTRRAEQNRVWVGLAKETAHQLGTPISGLMGWVEVLKINPEFDQTIGDEMLKDIQRLETITSRFSNIGSVPNMKAENVGELIESTVEYLKKRISTKVTWTIENNLHTEVTKDINKNLIEWVIENICKNAVDAMTGVGSLNVNISNYAQNKIKIDITDSGKGMTMAVRRNIFNAGYSTKKRGWGLGLTLAKRIVETYHHGQLYVADSAPGKGTTFRIIL